MERERRFRPFSSGVALAAAATLFSSFAEPPPRDGPCGPEMLIYEANAIAERSGIYGTLPDDCPAEAIHGAREEFTRKNPPPEGIGAVGWHGYPQEIIFAESEYEAKTRDSAENR